jgi:hypothetical protein
MNLKIQKNVSAKIYLNQINGCLLLNGRIINSKSLELKIVNNLLNSLSISVNLLKKKERKGNIKITNKLLLEISKKILKLKKKEKNILPNNIQKKSEKKERLNLSFPILIVIFILFLVFLLDYKSTSSKMNESNILEIKEIENQYKINKCEKNGNLPSLKPKCEEMLNKIEILKNKKFNTLSVFSTWGLDVFYSAIKTYDFKNIVMITLLFAFIYRLFR